MSADEPDPAVMAPGFVHLRVRSEYSLVDSTIRIPSLVRRTAELGMGAVAITEQDNLFSVVKFISAARVAGLKPIVGAEVNIGDADGAVSVTLLCQDVEGYRNLSALISAAYLAGQVTGRRPTVPRAALIDRHAGLVAVSPPGCGIGRVAATRELDSWLNCFEHRLFLAVERTGRPDEAEQNLRQLQFADRHALPIVATNSVRFLLAEDYEAHEARVCIHRGLSLRDANRPRDYSVDQYLKSPQQMLALFEDLPAATANTVAVAQMCNLELETGTYFLPRFGGPDANADQLLEEQVAQCLVARMRELTAGPLGLAAEPETYQARLARELEVIRTMGFAGYFLIVADFVGWAKREGIPVGPGRGSGAGSLVAFSLGITDLDPLRYDLLFERFLNPERVSMPDFDIDFCMERRDEVIAYVVSRYGADRVAQIITFGTMAAKAVVRDVGRVLGHPFGFVDRVAKQVPFEIGITLERALQESSELKQMYAEQEDVQELIDLAMKLEGLARNAGKHAGGVVIAPEPVKHYLPLYCEPDGSNVVTQLDMIDVETIGLVKFDFLGLKTLTIIDWAVRDINAAADPQQPTLSIEQIPLDDRATYRLIERADTTAVFQLESTGMRKLIAKLKPDKFDDLIALVALFRPGPLQSGMVDDYVERKHGRARTTYLHPELQPILDSTYGVILYQEQVMQIAQVLAGYTLGGADLLRRAMGKKKPAEMAKQRERFLAGAAERGIDSGVSESVFNLMEHFAGYGFNKSHSAAYALVAYQTAWLKTHHPATFMAAVLTADIENTDKVVRLVDDCRHLGLEVLPPDVNASDYRFTAQGEKTVRFGLGALKGVGRSAIDSMQAERNGAGVFTSLREFCRRVDLRKLNRRALETLVKAGAMDCLDANRRVLWEDLETAINIAEQENVNAAVGQSDLFGVACEPAPAVAASRAVVADWCDDDRLRREKEALGLYLSGHPLDRLRDELLALGIRPLNRLSEGKRRRVAGLLLDLRVNRKGRGPKATGVLDDGTARAGFRMFEELFEQVRERIGIDKPLIVEGRCGIDDYNGEFAITAERILSIEEARLRFAKRVVVELAESAVSEAFLSELTRLCEAGSDGCPVTVNYRSRSARATLRLGDSWRMQPTEAIVDRASKLDGIAAIRVEYSG